MKIQRGDVIFTYFKKNGTNIQYGYRPCVVIQNNIGNGASPNIIVCPITSNVRKKLCTHVSINMNQKSIILCEHIQTISKENIDIKGVVYKLSKKECEDMNKALKISVSLC